MRSRLTVGVFALTAVVACDDIPDGGLEPSAVPNFAEVQIPEPASPWDHFRVEHIEGDYGPGYAEEGTVNYYVQDHLVYSTPDGCHMPEDGVRECGYPGPKAVTAGASVAFSLPEAHSFGIIRDGEVLVEIPVNFEVAWLRFDGENIWVMPEKYLSGDEPPLLFSPDGELVGVPHYWSAR